MKSLIILGVSLIILLFVGVNVSNFLYKTFYGKDIENITIYMDEDSIKEIHLKIGEPVESSKIKMSVKEIYRTQKVKGNMGYRKIKDNETFIIVKVRVDNLREDSSYYISNMDFFLVDENGKKYDCEMNVLDVKDVLTITTIPPRRYVEGYIIYKVPKDIKTVKITYNFRNIQNIFDSYKAVWEINMSDIPYIEEFPQNTRN
ncbi:DUF4352 domain-containing protein [Methanocaldococcus bathoardescens]|uniref:DUF4352 domain-containing protein n=1 Tax=Methanocaldococcus bathoardescens TaxID=1301915 RepID=UPI001F20AC1D|nr:DUF4352 domain-containing protein [Methanocaldococcus bathoardescens]